MPGRNQPSPQVRQILPAIAISVTPKLGNPVRSTMANVSGGSSGGTQSSVSSSTCCTCLRQQASCWPCSRLAYKRSNVVRSGCVDIIWRGGLASFSKWRDSLSFRRCSSLPSRWPACWSFTSGRAWLPLLCTILPLQACCSTKCLNGASFQLFGQFIGITCNQIALVCGWHSLHRAQGISYSHLVFALYEKCYGDHKTTSTILFCQYIVWNFG
jgi:hypothetical protein